MSVSTQTVKIDSIQIPKRWRKVSKKGIEELARSLKIDGLLQPIGLVKEGVKFRLVFGRHRLEAARSLGWPEIDARVLDADETAERSATDAENLFRNPLSPAEKIMALKNWAQRYRADNPEVAGSNVARAREFIHPDSDSLTRPESFDNHVASRTGISAPAVRRMDALAKVFSEEELMILGEGSVPQDGIGQIAKLDEESRRACLTYIVSGMPWKEAIIEALAPDEATIHAVKPSGPQPKREEEMTDDEWLAFYCGDVLARLKYTAPFKRDALLYRHTKDIRQKLRNASKKALAQGKSQIVGPFFLLFARFINIDGPENWLPCGPCGGSGMKGDQSKCGNCNGHAYKPTSATSR